MNALIKSSTLALTLVSGLAFAQGNPAPTAPSAAESVPSNPTPAPGKKISHKLKVKEAREECLKENPSLKGKDLRSCVKGKVKPGKK